MPKSKGELKQRALNELRKHGNVSRAARALKINRRTIHRWGVEDHVFSAAAKAALKEGRE